MEDPQKIVRSIMQLGPRRLTILGVAGLITLAGVAAIAWMMNRPQYETLYAGLDHNDVAAMSAALREANLTFDVASDGATVLIESGQAARARMLLAERGLPHGAGSGYELFDKMGSLGLTSFMQEVTRVRALEGELARSIQAIQGVRAARVHIVMAEDSGFRRTKQAASASVVVRLSSAYEVNVAGAIRHLVAAATPGLTVDAVTVLDTDGRVLASGSDSDNGGPVREMALENSISNALSDNIRRALTPIVGLRNMNVSVAVRLNTDKRQTNETIYNPDARVERSVRVVKESQTSQNAQSQAASSVDRNIPGDKRAQDSGRASEENQKREELTNYEISTKTIQTTSGGYSIDRISAAVVIDQASLAGADAAPGAADKKLAELSDLAASAAGIVKERGDTIKLTAAKFADEARDMDAVSSPGFVQMLTRQTGAIINALAALGVAALFAAFGLRPLARSFADAAPPALPPAQEAPMMADTFDAGPMGDLALGPMSESPREATQRRLQQTIDSDEEHAAAVLKRWIREGQPT
ncbi:MAG: flagellar M-ring protein FliF [Hyphomicrobiales bacterium]|nr:flagellar M-ring protein FliF [Hyphomicrobiales bacterium]